jgi:hypothetical protein
MHISPTITLTPPSPVTDSFLDHLALHKQQAGDLRQLYQAWIARLIALHAGEVTGIYHHITDPAQTALVKEALDQRSELLQEIQSLRKQAEKEKQLSRRVEFNLHIKARETKLQQLTQNI